MSSSVTEQRQALIVGCTDGIGLALVGRLLEDGWRVIGVSRRPSFVDHPSYHHQVADVAEVGYASALAGLLEKAARIDLCVYAAGIGELLDLTRLGQETQVFAVNLLGAVRTLEQVLPLMLARKEGQVIVLSSLADVLVSAETPSYAASKAGLSMFVEGLGLALRSHNVTVTNLRLGFVDTKMAKAPRRAFLVPRERAVAWIMHCVRRRPLRFSRPRRMAWLVGVLAFGQRIARWWRG